MDAELPNAIATNFNCEQCGKVFLNIGDFVTHKQLYQNVRHFFCDLCETIFDKLKLFNVHFRQCERRKRFSCDECFETFNHEINLRLHKVLHQDKPLKCPECEKIFPRLASFKCHLIMHRVDETVFCDQCQEEFVFYFELQRHIKIVHNETFSNTTQLYVCKQCDAAFKRPLELAEHRITHKKIKDTLNIKKKKRSATSIKKRVEPLKFVKCKICDKQFGKQSSLERHERIHTGEKPFACKVCNKSFNQKGSLMFHEAKHLSEKPYKCQLCGVGFTQRGNLRTHVKRVHPANAAGRPAYECPLCSCVMRSLQSLNAHLSKRHNDALKYLDVDGSSKLDSLAVVQLNVQGQMENPNIFYSFSNQYDPPTSNIVEQELTVNSSPPTSSHQLPAPLLSTMAQVLQQSETNSSQVAVGLKKKSPKVASSMTMKRQSNEENDAFCGSNIRGVKIRDKLGRNVWLCPYCPRELARSSDLVRHVRVHTGEKPYKCTMCTKSFALRTTRDQHSRTHCGIKAMRCYICFKELSTNYTLKAHMRIHRNEAFQCEKCPNKRFRTRAHLNTHWRRMHDGEMNESALTVIQCPPLNNQAKSKTIDDATNCPLVVLEEPYVSTDQGFLFQTVTKGSQNDPKTMACVRNDDGSLTFRPFPCKFCDQKFKKANHLQIHERSHTGEKPYECRTCKQCFVTGSSLKDHLQTHGSLRNFGCDRCYKSFKNKRTLSRHMFVHTDERPFICPYCQKSFRRGVLCRRHIKTHRRGLELQFLKQMESNNLQEVQPNGSSFNEYGAEMHNENYIMTASDNDVQNDYCPMATAQYIVDQPSSYVNIVGESSHNDPISSQIHCHEVVESPCLDQFSAEILSPNGLQNLMNELDAVSMQVASANELHHQPAQYVTVPSCPNETYIVQHDQNQELIEDCLMHVCSMCYEGFADPQVYQAHLNLHQPPANQSSMSLNVIEKPSVSHMCSICMLNFSSDQSLNRHMRVVHKQENAVKYACPICGKTFSRATHVNRHIFHVHRNKKTVPPNVDSTIEHGVHAGAFQHESDWLPSTSIDMSTETNFIGGGRQNPKLNMSGQLSLHDLCQTANVPVVEHHEATVLTVTAASVAAEKQSMSSTSISNRFLSNRRQCPFENCPKSFKKPSDLARHFRCHTGEKPFPCDECGRTFRVKSTLIAHKKTHINSAPMHKCQACNKDFASRGSLKVHFRLHTNERPYACGICPESFRSSGLLRHHVSLAHGTSSTIDNIRTPVAPVSNISHAVVADRKTIPDSHPHGAFTCAETSAFTPVVRHHGMENRIETVQNGVGDELNGSTKIALQVLQEDNNLRLLVKPGVVEPVDANTVVVEVIFLRELAANGLTLTIPVSFVDGDLAGDSAMTAFTVNPLEILAHASVANSAPSLIQSGSNFVQTAPNFNETYGNNFVVQQNSTSTNTVDRVVVNADTADNEIFVVECKLCSLKFTNRHESDMHFQSKEHEISTLIVAQTNGAKQHLCDRCGKTFPSLGRLRRHVATHTGHRPHICTTCGESFTQKNTLKKHFSARHMLEKPFKCTICTKSFTHKCNLQKHIERTHGNGDDQNLISVDSQWPTVDSHTEQAFLLRL